MPSLLTTPNHFGLAFTAPRGLSCHSIVIRRGRVYSIVKGSSVGIEVRSILEDLGCTVRLEVRTDSSAAKEMASRRGLGKVRLVEVNQLWVQEKVGSGEVRCCT